MTQEAAKKERVAKVIEVLNKARSMELYAVHQYMNQHYNLDDLDYGEFASKIKLIAIDEMRHAEQFAERIKELGGEPNSELSSKITKGQKVMDVFPFNVKVEDDTIETYNKLLETCRTNGDSVSARLFERILDEEQVHDNYFCNMAKHIETLGNTYLSKIAGSDSPEIRAAAACRRRISPLPERLHPPKALPSIPLAKSPCRCSSSARALCIKRLEGEGNSFLKKVPLQNLLPLPRLSTLSIPVRSFQNTHAIYYTVFTNKNITRLKMYPQRTSPNNIQNAPTSASTNRER